MRATTEPLDGNKIRLSVEIDEPEVDRALDGTIRDLARQARVPGFRPGKVPRPVLEARMGGAAALRSEALREIVPEFYAKAVVEAEVDPIAPPEIDVTAGEEEGAVSFDAVVEVRPTVGIPGYGGLQVTVPSPVVTDAEVDARLDVLRETEAELVAVDRPAVDGDHVTIDLHGRGPADEAVVDLDDYLYEVGSGRLLPELDVQLRGARVGDALAFAATPPGGTAPSDGEGVSFRVLVKEVKEKKLPDLTDEWAAESSELATVAELRDDLRGRLGRAKALQVRLVRQERALEALAGLVDDEEVPGVLVDEELRQRVHDLSHRLEEQRVGLEAYLEATGQTGDELVARFRADAHRAVKVDLALRSLATAEDLEVDDDELEAELDTMATRLEVTPADLRRQLERAGRTAAVRSEQRKGKALTWLLDHVAMVDEEGNEVTAEDVDRAAGDDGTGEAAGAREAEGTEG
jgi:trigger factor